MAPELRAGRGRKEQTVEPTSPATFWASMAAPLHCGRVSADKLSRARHRQTWTRTSHAVESVRDVVGTEVPPPELNDRHHV